MVQTRPERILVCDELHPVALEVFREQGFEPELCVGLSEDQLVERVPGAAALVVRSATRVTRRVLEAAGDLAVVGRAGVGVDNVDVETASIRGVVVMNTPTGNTTTTAELAVALLLALARHIPRADRSVRAGSWKKKGLVGTELTGKTLGVIGLGRIGRVVAARGLGLAMRVVAHDPYLAADAAPPVDGVELLELDELLACADFVTLHVPLMPATRNLLSAERIAAMKPGARLINAARGGLVDEAAVARALDAGQLAGAAFDVLAEEPPAADHALAGRDDVIVTPHLGASSSEAQQKVARDVAQQIARFFIDGVAENAVNAPNLPREVARELAPFLLLAERIGLFLAQLAHAPLRKLELTVSGALARHPSEPLQIALLSGVLRESQPEGVNFVNAPRLAEERGLRVLASQQEASYFAGGELKVRASTRAGEESHVVTGTVFGTEPRLVRVDDAHIDLPPRGTLLLTRHRDRPGVIGELGTVLGRRGVNIVRLELGPGLDKTDGADSPAHGFLTLEGQVTDDLLEDVLAIEAIEAARLVRL